MFPGMPSVCLTMLPTKARLSSLIQWSLRVTCLCLESWKSSPGACCPPPPSRALAPLSISERSPGQKILFWPLHCQQRRRGSQELREHASLLCEAGGLLQEDDSSPRVWGSTGALHPFAGCPWDSRATPAGTEDNCQSHSEKCCQLLVRPGDT